MKLLVDANLSPRLAEGLVKEGFEASHVMDHGLLTASDHAIMAFAAEVGATIVSADSDFTTMLALSGADTPSLVLLRSADALTASAQCSLLVQNLRTVKEEIHAGAVVSVSRDHLRVRSLPISRKSKRS
jgi:predicted nuclease of predicted toxin-antitoxin system